jgi:FkbM family methyltransferase
MLRRLVLSLLPAGWRGRLRAWRTRRLVAGYPPRRVRHIYGTGPLTVELTDPLAAGWYDSDWPDLPEIKALRARRLRPGATVFDLGAHHGVVALMLAREVRPGGRVVAVEANPHNARSADRNRVLNPDYPVTVVQAAVSDAPGRLTFNQGLNGAIDCGAGEWGRIEVDAVTIDELARRFGRPDVVFLDVEGAEARALRGAVDTLAGPTDWFIEVHTGSGLEQLGGSVDEILSYFPTDRHELLFKAEADPEFRPLDRADPVVRDRFFLLACHRAA